MDPFRPTARVMLGCAGALILLLSRFPAAVEPAPIPDDQRSVAHVLNRLAFGARPGDIDRIAKSGLAAWIDAQLQPQRIANDELNGRLAGLTTLTLDSGTIARDYFAPARLERRKRQQANPDGRAGQNGVDPAGAMPERMDARSGPGAEPSNDVIRRERQIFAELAEAKLLRAVYSDRQLEEVLTDFWFNHFNVFARKGRTEIYVGEYERDAIRPHVLGSFRELLGATAKSPAMLFYLDNWMSAAAGARAPLLHVKDGPCQLEAPMTALGEGVVDIPNVVAAGAGSTEWLVVELDECATDMLEAVRKSYQYLIEKGLGRGNKN